MVVVSSPGTAGLVIRPTPCIRGIEMAKAMVPSVNSYWDRNIEIHMQRKRGATISELCQMHHLSEQRIKQILAAVETKIRAGQIR